MGKFRHIAERIAGIIEEMKGEGGISADRIPDILNDLFGGELGNINCYPGKPGYDCYDFAMFLSLTSEAYAKGRGHLTCRKAMEKIVQHMQGLCSQKTRDAVFITDSWDATAFNEWRANLAEIRNNACLEIYLISGRAISEIYIS
jgi:hypothetical protein